MPRRGDATRERFIAGDPLRGLLSLGVLAVHVFAASLVTDSAFGTESTRILDEFRLQFGFVGDLIIFATKGIWVFLVLSGYLISRPFVGAYLRGTPLPRTGRYLRGRLLRIVPVFWVAVLGTLLLFGTQGTSWERVLATFGFVGVYFPSDVWRQIGQSWTLTTEMSFYLALPVFMFLLARLVRPLRNVRGRAVVLAGALGLVALGSLLFRLSEPETFGGRIGITSTAYTFVPGIALAMLEHWLPRRVAGRRAAVLAGGIIAGAAVLAMFVLSNGFSGRLAVFNTLCAGLLVGGCLLAQWAGGNCWRLLDNRLLHYLGERSYSIYLVHIAIIGVLLEPLGPNQHSWHRAAFLGPATLVLSLVVAEVLHRAVELPAMRRKRPRREAVQTGTDSGAPLAATAKAGPDLS